MVLNERDLQFLRLGILIGAARLEAAVATLRATMLADIDAVRRELMAEIEDVARQRRPMESAAERDGPALS